MIMRLEYPRPELVRENWISLHGEWDFAFDYTNSHECIYPHFNPRSTKTYTMVKKFTHKINVPFVPECELSGLNHLDFINGCWYKKEIDVSEYKNKRIILRFEAVFHTSHLYVNNKEVGVHKGGYTPFSYDITDYLEEGKGEILLHVDGDARNLSQPSGKQASTLEPVGCFYQRCTGIWAPVWIDIVPTQYIESIRYYPDVDNCSVTLKTLVKGKGLSNLNIRLYYDGKEVGIANHKINGDGYVFTEVKLLERHLWEVGKGGLYDVKLTLENEKNIDEVKSYFGLRKLELDDKGLKINGKRIFQRLVLDQGYYPEGMYTAKDVSDFKKDIKISMAMGFNGARLHEKVFDRSFLYFADKLGYLVWGEYPSWGFDYSKDDALSVYLPEWQEALERDVSHPCIIGWCPLNENWDLFGKRQNDTFVRQLYEFTKLFDPTRPCIDVSWNYHVKTDIYDVHDYSQGKLFVEHMSKFEEGKVFESITKQQMPYQGQPYFVSEYGGLKWPVDLNGWGYNGNDHIKSEEDFVERLRIFQDTMYSNSRICASCYTQLYDVQQECNGLYYYNREIKFSPETIRKIHEVISKEALYEKLD